MAATQITADANHSTIERLAFLSLRETAGAAAVVNFRVAAVGGRIVFSVPLAANQGINWDMRPKSFDGGVYVEVASGDISGQLDEET
jgi:hypothetical protein